MLRSRIAREAPRAPSPSAAPPCSAPEVTRLPSFAHVPLTLQAKGAGSGAEDPLEREADRAAEAVVRGVAGPVSVAPASGLAETRLSPQAEAGVRAAVSGAGRPLGAGLLDDLQPRFGRDLGAVRLHTGPQAAASASALSAHAYTVGPDIVFGEGRFAPHTGEGRRLLAHELAHTVQQDGGGLRVQRQVASSAAQRFAAVGFQRMQGLYEDLAALGDQRGCQPDDTVESLTRRYQALVAERDRKRFEDEDRRTAIGLDGRILPQRELAQYEAEEALKAGGGTTSGSIAASTVAMRGGSVEEMRNAGRLFGAVEGVAAAVASMADQGSSNGRSVREGEKNRHGEPTTPKPSRGPSPPRATGASRASVARAPSAPLSPRPSFLPNSDALPRSSSTPMGPAAPFEPAPAPPPPKAAPRVPGGPAASPHPKPKGVTDATELHPATGAKPTVPKDGFPRVGLPKAKPGNDDAMVPGAPPRPDYYVRKVGDVNVEGVSGELRMAPKEERDESKFEHQIVAGRTGDDAGHRRSSENYGADDRRNLGRQNSIQNRFGTWRQRERAWNRTMEEGGRVFSTVEDHTKPGANRPYKREANWTEVRDGVAEEGSMTSMNPESKASRTATANKAEMAELEAKHQGELDGIAEPEVRKDAMVRQAEEAEALDKKHVKAEKNAFKEQAADLRRQKKPLTPEQEAAQRNRPDGVRFLKDYRK